VVVADLNAEAGSAVAQALRSDHPSLQPEWPRALFIANDVTQPDAVERLIARTLETYGRLDVLVNNAGGTTAAAEDFLHMGLAAWDQDLALNLRGPFLCAQAALRVMLRQEGRGQGVILNVSSVNALVAIDSPAYSAAKAGLLALTRHIATFYGSRVRCNALCLGTIGTATVLSHWRRRRGGDQGLRDWYPTRTIGRPEEVAALAVFLASDEACFINGAALVVDGGLTAGLPHFGKPLRLEYTDG
jgi:NAD(P)-dependent dehydrogenase (short-subunit alcohol dehydrogenase family)